MECFQTIQRSCCRVCAIWARALSTIPAFSSSAMTVAPANQAVDHRLDAVTSLLPRWRLTGVSWRLKASNATFAQILAVLSISRRIGVGGMKR